jgi:hypothetical protein
MHARLAMGHSSKVVGLGPMLDNLAQGSLVGDGTK